MSDGDRSALSGPTAVLAPPTERVLVLDGTGFFFRSVGKALGDTGLVLEAVASEAAIAAAVARGPALLVVDLGAPPMTDLALLKRLRARWGSGTLPVLVASDTPLTPQQVALLQGLDCQGFVSMFAPADHLLFRVNAALHQEQDGRRSMRVPLSVPVQVRHGRATTFAQAYNVSSDGMYVRAADPPPEGTRVVVRFALPGGSVHVHAEAVVRHARTRDVRSRVPPGFGLEFTHVEEADATALAAHVEAALVAQPWK